MRFVWVDEGQSPDYTKGDKHGVTGYFLPMFSTEPRQLAEIKNRGKVAGLYYAWSWKEVDGLSPEETAAKVAAEYKRCFVPDLRLQHDNERHNASEITRLLLESRRLLPTAGTSWTLEGHQAGWFDGPLINAIIKTKTRVVPQLYNGQMTVHYDSLAEVRKWIAYGVPEGMVSPFYDAARIPAFAEGYLFTQGRLP